jgi:hypothetical protein
VDSSRHPAVCGDQLFVYLLRLRPNDGQFPLDTKLYYDVQIDSKGLAEHGLITGPRALVYPDEKLPSFFIPSLHSNIFQGSCRKPHAEHDSKPQYDQMRSADTLLQETCNQIKQRPSLLTLSGDQIYADDVSPALLAALIEKAEALTGWKEQLPTAEGPVLVPADLELCGRDSLLNADITGFSSGEKKNHLLTFGEFIAMYLAVWGDVSLHIPEFDEIDARIKRTRVRAPGKRGQRGARINKRVIGRRRYKQEARTVGIFLDNSWQARRLMANIP